MAHRDRRLHPDPVLAMRLAAEAACDPRVAARAIRGERVQPLTHVRIAIAARALGIPLPEQPNLERRRRKIA
jgi:hypothetical protein